MFIVWPRTKPTNVRPAWWARSTASELGAETAASSGIPANTAFCVSSKEARPETTKIEFASGALLADGPADDLVHGVVPTDVFPHTDQCTVGGQQPGSVQPSGLIEAALPGAQLVRCIQNHVWRNGHHRRQPKCRGAEHLLDGRGAADPAGTGHEHLATELRKWGHHVAGQPHIEHVVGIPSVSARTVAVPRTGDVGPQADDRFAEEDR